jgi:FKBP-type peptidyl-prolyl cis-trans isomerase
MKAFFARQVEAAGDSTKTNEQQIKEEAQRRKALRDAKHKVIEAEKEANRVKTPEEVAKDLQLEADRRKRLEEAEKKKQEEEEKAARTARKAALNAKWGGSSNNLTGSVSKSSSGEH